MYFVRQAIAIAILISLGSVVAAKTSFAQSHGGHHSAPSGGVVPDLTAQERKAEAYVNQGLEKLHQKDYQGAIDNLTKAVKIQPNHYIAYTYRGDIFRTLGKYQAAIDDYTKAIKSNPSHSYLHNSRGIAYAALGEYQKAIADHSGAIEIYPEEGAGYRYRGAMYFKVGENQKALDDLERAIIHNQNDAEAYTYRGEVQAKLGNTKAAISDLQKAAKIFAAQSNKAGYNRATNLAKTLQQATPTATSNK